MQSCDCVFLPTAKEAQICRFLERDLRHRFITGDGEQLGVVRALRLYVMTEKSNSIARAAVHPESRRGLWGCCGVEEFGGCHRKSTIDKEGPPKIRNDSADFYLAPFNVRTCRAVKDSGLSYTYAERTWAYISAMQHVAIACDKFQRARTRNTKGGTSRCFFFTYHLSTRTSDRDESLGSHSVLRCHTSINEAVQQSINR